MYIYIYITCVYIVCVCVYVYIYIYIMLIIMIIIIICCNIILHGEVEARPKQALIFKEEFSSGQGESPNCCTGSSLYLSLSLSLSPVLPTSLSPSLSLSLGAKCWWQPKLPTPRYGRPPALIWVGVRVSV